MTTLARLVLVLVAFAAGVLVCSCSTSGPVTGAVVAGTAGMLAVFDQLLQSGVLDAAQHAQIVQGINGLDAAVQSTAAALATAQQGLEAVKAGGVTPAQASGIAGGTMAALLAAWKSWQAVAGTVRNVKRAAAVGAAAGSPS